MLAGGGEERYKKQWGEHDNTPEVCHMRVPDNLAVLDCLCYIALTVVRPLLPSLGEMSNIIHKANIMRELDHPNVVSIYDFYQEDPEHFYMVLEFMEGGELFGRIVKKASSFCFVGLVSVSLSSKGRGTGTRRWTFQVEIVNRVDDVVDSRLGGAYSFLLALVVWPLTTHPFETEHSRLGGVLRWMCPAHAPRAFSKSWMHSLYKGSGEECRSARNIVTLGARVALPLCMPVVRNYPEVRPVRMKNAPPAGVCPMWSTPPLLHLAICTQSGEVHRVTDTSSVMKRPRNDEID